MKDLNLLQNIISAIAIVGGAVIVLTSKVKNDNLKDLQQRVGILENLLDAERNQAREQHVENQKAISNLEGQLKTYKDIPLKQIAESLNTLAESNRKILVKLSNKK